TTGSTITAASSSAWRATRARSSRAYSSSYCAGYREAFVAYARTRPMAGGYRRDALDFARHLLDSGRPGDVRARRRLYRWWAERAGPRPAGRAARLVHAARAALVV
ncbi:hypothetical protein AB0G31_27415, partial [Streptomyces fradiae]